MNKYRAVKCPCGHQACKAWHVSEVAHVQGVSFTEDQANAVAELLNLIDDPFDGAFPPLGSLMRAIFTARLSRRGVPTSPPSTSQNPSTS